MTRYGARGRLARCLDGTRLSCIGFVALALLSGCARCESRRDTIDRGSERLDPLVAKGWLVSLEVPGHLPARVALPLGATEPRPVLIALHGGADRPEWQCGSWRGIAPRAFILCPAGKVLAGGVSAKRFSWGATEEVEEELRAALKALKARHQDYLAPPPVVLAAYGAGAEHAVALALQSPTFFSRLVLVNGGADRITSSYATRFAERGGERILVACGLPSCAAAAKTATVWANRAGAQARLVYPGPTGSQLDEKLLAPLRGQWGWLVEDEPRWQSERPRAELTGHVAVPRRSPPP